MQLAEDVQRDNLLEIESHDELESPKTIERLNTCTLTEESQLPARNDRHDESPGIRIQEEDINMVMRGPHYQTTITTTAQRGGPHKEQVFVSDDADLSSKLETSDDERSNTERAPNTNNSGGINASMLKM